MTFANKTVLKRALETLSIHRKSVFRYPLEPAPRTAVLAACFRRPSLRPNYPIRIFPEGWCQEASAFAPAAIAATREKLFEIATAEQRPVLSHAVIALVKPGDPILSMAEREHLWRAFRVPVFEQIIGPNGLLLAAECEAHNGLHIESPGLPCDGFQIEPSACGCGRKTPRLTSVLPVEQARGAAAFAR